MLVATTAPRKHPTPSNATDRALAVVSRAPETASATLPVAAATIVVLMRSNSALCSDFPIPRRRLRGPHQHHPPHPHRPPTLRSQIPCQQMPTSASTACSLMGSGSGTPQPPPSPPRPSLAHHTAVPSDGRSKAARWWPSRSRVVSKATEIRPFISIHPKFQSLSMLQKEELRCSVVGVDVGGWVSVTPVTGFVWVRVGLFVRVIYYIFGVTRECTYGAQVHQLGQVNLDMAFELNSRPAWSETVSGWQSAEPGPHHGFQLTSRRPGN